MRTFMKNTMSLASKTISIAACVLSLCMNQPSLAQFMEFKSVKVSSDGTAMMLSTAEEWNTNLVETKIYRWSASTGVVLIKTFPANTYSTIDYGNANGTTAIGSHGSDTVSKVWRWTSTGGFNDAIGLAGYAHSTMPDGLQLGNTSADGTVIAGYSYNGSDPSTASGSRTFRWVAGSGSTGKATDIGMIPGDTDADMYCGVVSSDGTVMFGRSWNSTAKVSHLFRWKKTTDTSGTLSKIADLGTFDFYQAGSVHYINANGTTLVASTYRESGNAIVRWTSAGLNSPNIGLTGFTGGHDVGGVSSDGTVIAGHSFNGYESNPSRSKAFRWVAGTGTTGTATPLGFLPGDTDSDTYGWDNKTISSDGTVIVGRSWKAVAEGMPIGARHVFRWVKNASNNSGVMTKIIDIPVNGDCDIAYINANGTTIVGSTSSYSYDGGVSTSTSQVWRWTSAGGLNSTIGLPTYSKHVLCSVSSDGTVIAGYSFSDSEWNGGSEPTPYKSNAFRWVATTATGNAGTTTALGHLAGDTDEDLDMYGSSMSLDGSVIVGMSWNSSSSPTPVKHAFRWQKTTANSGVMIGIVAAPTITTVSPTSGPLNAGTAFTITGTNLTGATTVTVGGVAATSVVVVSATSITAKTPVGTAGAKSIAVTTVGGTATKASAFTYIAAPTITTVSPTSGPLAAGAPFTITGTNLTGATSVTVGGVAATSVVVVSATSITAKTPDGTAGAKSIAVTTVGGTATKASAFTYISAPTMTTVSPTSGPLAAGTVFTITGTNLTGATSVTVGGFAATNVVATATSITATTPTGTAGAKNVAVTTVGGTVTKVSAFTYITAPTITTVSPTSGPLAAGTDFTITGTNLTGATSVKVNGVAATSVVVVSATSITAKTPAGTAGAKSVAVTTAGGTATKASAFTYIAAPTITSISPTVGTTAGGTTVTVTGTNLTGATLTVEGTSIPISSNTGTSFKIITPEHSDGVISATLSTLGGTVTRANAFTFVGAPTVTSISPTSGPTRGGTVVTITGKNLTGAKVTVAGTNIPVYSNTGTSFKLTTPAYYSGYISATLTTLYGSVTEYDVFYYYSGFVGEVPSGNGNTNNNGSGVAGTSSNGSNSSAGQASSNNPNDGTAVEPIGIALYLQTISQHADAQVVCADTSATTSVDAIDSTGNAVTIDLDHNGEPDICQLRGGDFDLNGVIDERDMAILFEMIDFELVLGIGDLDGNGEIDAGDISLLLLQMQ